MQVFPTKTPELSKALHFGSNSVNFSLREAFIKSPIESSVRKAKWSQKKTVQGKPKASILDRKPFEKRVHKSDGEARVILFASLITKTAPVLLPSVPLAQLHNADVCRHFGDRKIQRQQKSLDDIYLWGLRQQVYVYAIASPLRTDKDTQISDAELSRLSGHSGRWVPGMIACHIHQLNSDKPSERGRPKLAESDIEQKFT
jgi:hypothetical protein